MTDILPSAGAAAASPTPSVATSATAAANAAAEDSAISNTLSDYDDFLTLLTTQMKNQDPLNPQDSTAFVEQIATFTGVEQQVASNSKLDELIALQTGDALSTLGVWIGQTVTAPNAGFAYSGDPVTLDVPADANASQASLTIRDAEGREVTTLPANAEGGPVTWDGTDSDGNSVEEGLYRAEYVYGRSTADGPETWSAAAEGVGRVVEARLNGGRAELVLDSGAIIDPNAATSIRAAASDEEY